MEQSGVQTYELIFDKSAKAGARGIVQVVEHLPS
jgi:hypothetical protein